MVLSDNGVEITNVLIDGMVGGGRTALPHKPGVPRCTLIDMLYMY